MIKKIALGVINKIADKISLLIVNAFITLAITIGGHLISKYFILTEVDKRYPKVYPSNVVNVNNELASLVSKCGIGSGSAFIEFDKKTKIMTFIEVFANDPFHGGTYASKYIKGNDYYLEKHQLDSFGEELIKNIDTYGFFDTESELWTYSKFFRNWKQNAWKVTNASLRAKGLPPREIKGVYVSTIKINDDIIYIIALATTEFTFCDMQNTIASEKDKIDFTGQKLFDLKQKAGVMLNIYEK